MEHQDAIAKIKQTPPNDGDGKPWVPLIGSSLRQQNAAIKTMISSQELQAKAGPSHTDNERASQAKIRWTLLIVLWSTLVVSWAITTWLGLVVIEAVYREELTGGIFENLLREADVRPLGYYRAVVWQLSSVMHFLGLIVSLVVATWRTHSATMLLSILLFGDLILLVCSITFGGRLAVNRDGGIPEVYQYHKEIMSAGACLWLWRRWSSLIFAVFAVLFAWLFIDDAFQYHERMGRILAPHLNLDYFSSFISGAPARDVGEALSFLVPLTLFLPFICLGYYRGDAFTRQASQIIVALIALFGVFGGYVDFLAKGDAVDIPERILSNIEEGGEMVVMSAIVAYVISLVWHGSDAGCANNRARQPANFI